MLPRTVRSQTYLSTLKKSRVSAVEPPSGAAYSKKMKRRYQATSVWDLPSQTRGTVKVVYRRDDSFIVILLVSAVGRGTWEIWFGTWCEKFGNFVMMHNKHLSLKSVFYSACQYLRQRERDSCITEVV